MRVSDFSFDLPDELIARYPAAARSASRLLHLPAVGEVVHRQLPDVVDQLQQGDLMVFNNTKVIAARLYGHKLSGGKLEALIERVTSESTALAHVRCSKSPKPGSTIQLGSDKGQGVAAKVISRQGALFELGFAQPVLEVLQRYGHIPLPPYIDRSDESLDIERYQTVYAQEEGAVAAPTAGLHFDEVILAKLQQRGVEFGYVTLHVGAGTFQPVRVDNIHDHVMHKEWLSVDEKLAAQVAACHARGGKVVAVGTTSVRALESAAVADYQIKAMTGDTDIFIFPGYQFRCVDKLITNFHLPQSTLLMLVSAFSGQPRIMAAYKQAVDQAYRFFSYGDAMLLERQEA